MSVSELWEDYAKTKSNETRNKLFIEYKNFLKWLTGRIMVPPGLEKDDLYQYGVFGLLEAIEKYDVSFNAKFETFATRIINGRITDRIREFGRASGGPSRTSIKKIKMVDQATRSLENKLKRNPTSKEIAEELNLTIEEYNKLLSDISVAMPISLDKMVGIDENLSAIEVLKNDQNEDLEDSFVKNEYIERISYIIEHELLPKERSIIVYYYYEELTLREIGKLMNLSESRISQLHTQAMFRLRSKLSGGD